MTWLEESERANEEKLKRDLAKVVYDELKKQRVKRSQPPRSNMGKDASMEKHGIDFAKREKEATTMQVTYNGFTGDLVKLERKHEQGRKFETSTDCLCGGRPYEITTYDISIYESEKKVTHSFTGVKLENVKFLGGEVEFGS